MNGKVGRSGTCGLNGNDMALIDRSASEMSKHYQGSSDRKLDWNYVYKAEKFSRLNGRKRYVDKANACFVKFIHGDPIDSTLRRVETTKERSVRKTTSEAVAKQSIMIDEVMSEAEAVFGKQSSFLADACKESAQAEAMNEDMSEDEEATENITEEVVVLRQKEDTYKLTKYTADNEKKVVLILSHIKNVLNYCLLGYIIFYFQRSLFFFVGHSNFSWVKYPIWAIFTPGVSVCHRYYEKTDRYFSKRFFG